jgi:hypothetical protein
VTDRADSAGGLRHRSAFRSFEFDNALILLCDVRYAVASATIVAEDLIRSAGRVGPRLVALALVAVVRSRLCSGSRRPAPNSRSGAHGASEDHVRYHAAEASGRSPSRHHQPGQSRSGCCRTSVPPGEALIDPAQDWSVWDSVSSRRFGDTHRPRSARGDGALESQCAVLLRPGVTGAVLCPRQPSR